MIVSEMMKAAPSTIRIQVVICPSTAKAKGSCSTQQAAMRPEAEQRKHFKIRSAFGREVKRHSGSPSASRVAPVKVVWLDLESPRPTCHGVRAF